MRLNSLERRKLFTAILPAHQLQKYLFKQPGYSASLEDLQEVFSDLSRASYLSMLFQLKAKGIIEIGKEAITLNVEKADLGERNIDIVWRDIRMLKTFTVDDIVSDTGLTGNAVREAIRVFIKQELIKPIEEAKPGKPRRYNLISSEIFRPVTPKKNFGALSDKVFEAVKKMPQPFYRAQLTAVLKEKKIEASPRYVKELLRQWLDMGILVEDGKRNDPHGRIRYRFVEGSVRPRVKGKEVADGGTEEEAY